ncbi:MAG: hypothetical protein H7Y13_04070 [Sphingobacteriaceae bacterium]|nr:hypothetical protein [Sphingobacteriaceae bacterium]
MKQIVIALLLIGVIGCKKSKSPANDNGPGPAPAKAVLIAPAANAACTEGQVVSAGISTIIFSWGGAANAESYDLYIKNLLTGSTSTHSSTSTQLSVNLGRNTPYSWYVISKSGKNPGTAQSDIRKFYNPGAEALTYAPYPADNLSPGMGQSVNAINAKIILDWDGEDADNDISVYDVYFGTTATTPPLLQANVTASTLTNVSVNSNSTYYWKVITKDLKGNSSASGVHSFKVN